MITPAFRTVVLDSEGLSAWVADDRTVSSMLRLARATEARIVISAATIIEVSHPRLNVPRFDYLLSGVRIEEVTAETARAAARLLKRTGLHGHKYAIDAIVAEAALRQPGPVAMLTSDTDDMGKLCGPQVRVVAV
ncbi:PIN domain-containing protein [Streptomyces sp. NPDC049954]|uniref:PIN domain-containing protein n=1 Tax=Streptomyces sp. NPDC049954 TaxID=3155779 RepID=UPI0034239C22